MRVFFLIRPENYLSQIDGADRRQNRKRGGQHGRDNLGTEDALSPGRVIIETGLAHGAR
jgi:hypothetical protein